jgi:chromosome segregation ATPase
MELPPTSIGLHEERAAIETELATLERREIELRSALHDVEHDMRRCNDALERLGWSSAEDETRRDLLLESRASIVRDRETIRDRCAELERRLMKIRQRFDEDTCDD